MGQFDNTALLFRAVAKLDHIFPAAVLDHEPKQIVEKLEIGAVDDHAAFPPRLNEARRAHMRKMKGQGIMGHLQGLTQQAGLCSIWSIFHQEAKYPEPGFLREGIESEEGLLYVHMSRLMDIWRICQLQGKERIQWVRCKGGRRRMRSPRRQH